MIPRTSRSYAQRGIAPPLLSNPPRELPLRLVSWVLLVAATCLSACGGCATPECGPNEIKVADTCYARRTSDAGAVLPDAASDPTCVGSDCEPPPGVSAVKRCDRDADCPPEFACEARACRFVPPMRLPSATGQSSGATSSASARYRLRWSVGAPHPIGAAASSRYRIQLGPRAE